MPPSDSPSAAPAPDSAGPDPLPSASRFLLVGERTNITGSPKFARALKSGDWDACLAIARQQVENGANVIDINVDEALIEGEPTMEKFLNLIAAEPEISRVPIMVDSSKWSVLAASRARGSSIPSRSRTARRNSCAAPGSSAATARPPS
jgi:cobalamin-dependent methionine synthase I